MASATNRAAVALLGVLLCFPDVLDEIAPIVRPEHFPGARGREVYAAMLSLRDQGIPVDFVLLCCELEARGTLTMVGTGNLIGMMNRTCTPVHAQHYARVLADAAWHAA